MNLVWKFRSKFYIDTTMKKTLYSILSLLGIFFTSCDMNMEPHGVLREENAIEKPSDCLNFRNGVYSSLRNATAGSVISVPSIQMDEFFGTTINGNRIGLISNGQIYSNDNSAESLFSVLYAYINNTCYFLEKAPALLENEDLTAEERIAISRYIGEVEFAQSYYYYVLVDRYCNSWGNVDPTAPATGVQLVAKYDPTGDRSKYPGRSTLAESFKVIEDGLADALVRIEEYVETIDRSTPNGETEYLSVAGPMAIYVGPMTIKALQCRVALLKNDYKAAHDIADDIIKNGGYTLSGITSYSAMWTDDNNNEIIFMPYASLGESAPTTGSAWISPSLRQTDYIPTAYVAQELYTRFDVRNKSFIGSRTININGSDLTVPAFVKFPGNPALNANPSTNALQNRPKPFRLSEIYLILAEASYELSLYSEANAALTTLRNNRINRYQSVEYSGTELRDEIRLERQRELIGEGFRMSDLRRWGLGFNRTSTDYTDPNVVNAIVKAGLISYPEGDHRFVWPIPATELRNNPQVASQQNPGY